jgi:putative glycerol-1-phosphate prenyltransferase
MLLEQLTTWRHVFKLDPNRLLTDAALQQICTAGSDALLIGGTDGITYHNTATLLKRVRAYELFCVQEISDIAAVVPGFDGYLIPAVLNTHEAKWFLGAHHEALKRYGDMMPWDDLLLTAYVSCNPAAKVSKLTKAQTALDIHDMMAYAQLADRLYHIPLFYLEYSGVFGDVAMLQAARRGLQNAKLFYGGGLSERAQVQQMAAIADTVVVGNLIYEDVTRAMESVNWVKELDLNL